MTSTVYLTGTVSVTNGNEVVTGAGTAWAVSLVTGGMFSSAGLAVPILSVESDTSLTLAYPWPGTTAAGAAYAIDRTNSDAANVVDLYDRLARVLVTLSLIGIHPNDSGTIAERDALSLGVDDAKFLFLHAEQGLPFLFYRWTGTAWEGPFDTRGLAGVGVGGLGLPTPGAANKFPYYTAANTVVLGDITAAGRAVLDDADSTAQRATLGAVGGSLGSFDNFMVRTDGTGGATAQGSVVIVDDSGNISGVPKLTGGGSASSGLSLQSTFGVGTTDFIDMLVGNNGATRALRIDTSGNLIKGSTIAQAINATATIAAMQMQGLDAASTAFAIFNNQNAAGGPTFVYIKSRATVLGGVTIVQSGDAVGTFSFRGMDGVKPVPAATISAAVDGPPGVDDMPGRIMLSTTSDGALAVTERLRIDSTGALIHRSNAQTLVTSNSHYQKRQYASGSLPSQIAADEIRSSDVITAALVSDGTQFVSDGVLVTAALTANGTIALPPGYAIGDIFFVNSTANAVTGGIKIGTTSGATDVVAAQAVGANAIGHVVNANVLKKLFSTSASQTLFIQAVTSWNSASVKLAFKLEKVF